MSDTEEKVSVEPTEDEAQDEGTWDLVADEELRPLDDEDEDGSPGHDDHGEDGLVLPQTVVGDDAEEDEG